MQTISLDVMYAMISLVYLHLNPSSAYKYVIICHLLCNTVMHFTAHKKCNMFDIIASLLTTRSAQAMY